MQFKPEFIAMAIGSMPFEDPEEAVDMEYMGKKVYGFLEFMERNNIKIEEPKEQTGKIH